MLVQDRRMGLAVSYNETFSEAAFSSVFVVSGVFLLSEVCMTLEHLKSFLFTFICVYECLLYMGMYVCIYVCMYVYIYFSHGHPILEQTKQRAWPHAFIFNKKDK